MTPAEYANSSKYLSHEGHPWHEWVHCAIYSTDLLLEKESVIVLTESKLG